MLSLFEYIVSHLRYVRALIYVGYESPLARLLLGIWKATLTNVSIKELLPLFADHLVDQPIPSKHHCMIGWRLIYYRWCWVLMGVGVVGATSESVWADASNED